MKEQKRAFFRAAEKEQEKPSDRGFSGEPGDAADRFMQAERRRKMRKRRVIRYSVSAAVYLALAVGVGFAAGLYSAEGAADFCGKLSNCFLVPAVLFASLGGLSWISSVGGYDAISYTFRNFSLHNIFPQIKGGKYPKYETFYEYKKAKDERGRTWWPHFLIIGGAGFLLSVLFLILYFIVG